MNTRQRFKAVMNFEPFDRLPLVEWASWWNKTIDRWHGEGLPTGIIDRYDIYSHFGLDQYKQFWFRATGADVPRPQRHGAGIIEDMSDYEKIRPHLFRDIDDSTVDFRMLEEWRRQQERGEIVFWITLEGFFWYARTLLGIENHLYAFYDQPELIHRINDDLAEWMLRVIERCCEYCTPDFMTFAEDMSYNNGPMLSEDLFDEFMLPYYRRVVPVLKSRDIIPIIDSDGDIALAVPWFERAGLEGILPLERQAGVDIAELRRRHPRQKFIGHYDKMVMNKGEAAMRAEFERLLPVAAKGGFIVSVDHQTPPGVSLADYELYLGLFREYAEEAGRLSREK